MSMAVASDAAAGLETPAVLLSSPTPNAPVECETLVVEAAPQQRKAQSAAPAESTSTVPIADEVVASGQGDSLVLGVSAMLLLTVVQRGVGFVRNLLFCRYLDEAELGLWSLAFSFLVLAAPLAVLGLPGSFGRYVEVYRQRRQLRTFLIRTATVSGLLGLAAMLLVVCSPPGLAHLVFNDSGQTVLLAVSGLALGAVVAFNFLTELLTSLRRFRLASMLQFIQGMSFTALGVAAVAFSSQSGAAAVAGAYGLACVVGIACVAPSLRAAWRELPEDGARLGHGEMWSRLLPFAAWVWVVNLLANLFEVADRAILVHFSQAAAEASQALVGQYHSSRVVPQLLVSLAAMLSGVLLPYLSRDWEKGERANVARRVNLALKLTAISFSLAAAATLAVSPLLFDWLLAGRYASGQAILPWALAAAIWFSLATVAQDYLWCAEKARLGAAAFLVGLVVNVGLGILLTGKFGLFGAMAASAAANLLLMAVVYGLCRRAGMRVDSGVWLISALPLAVGFGLWAALAALGLSAVVAWRSEILLTKDEKPRLADMGRRAIRFLARRTASRTPGGPADSASS